MADQKRTAKKKTEKRKIRVGVVVKPRRDRLAEMVESQREKTRQGEGLVEVFEGLDVPGIAGKLADATLTMKATCDAVRQQGNRLIVEMLASLGVLTDQDMHLYRDVLSLDYFPVCEGERKFRRYLARSERLRDLCKRYRPATWEKFAPTAEEIRTETAKWKRQQAKEA